MIAFQPSEPFPQIAADFYEYADAQAHADRVDKWLGLNIDAVERKLGERGCLARAVSDNREHQELWIGLAVKSLLTPYVEIRSLLSALGPRPGHSVVDLGAAYGRMGFVIERHFPGVRFTGYEYVGERVEEGRRAFARHGLRASELEHADLSASGFRPAPADIYFLYDYGTSKAIEKTLHDLRRIALGRDIALVARGARCREAIQQRHPWLTQMQGPGYSIKGAVFAARGANTASDRTSILVGGRHQWHSCEP